jgi:hypothetical protein
VRPVCRSSRGRIIQGNNSLESTPYIPVVPVNYSDLSCVQSPWNCAAFKDPSIHTIPFRIPGASRHELEALHYYCVYMTTEFAKYPSNSFWAHTVLQWSAKEQTIRQSLIALCSSHRSFGLLQTEGTVSRDSPETIKEYNKALRLLRHYITSTAPCNMLMTVLMSCTILYCVACATKKFSDASIHLRAGLNILHSWMVAQHRQKPFNVMSLMDRFEGLFEVFSQMHLQAAMFDDSLPPFLPLAEFSVSYNTAEYGPWYPDTFKSVIEAQVALETMQGRLFQRLISTDLGKSAAFNLAETELGRQIASWRLRFSTIINEGFNIRAPTPMFVKSHIVLLASQQWMLSLLVKGDFLGNAIKIKTTVENVFSSLKSNFVRDIPSGRLSSDQSKFLFRPGTVSHLYLQLAKPRDRALQCKILSVLRTVAQQDMGNFNEKMVFIETFQLLMEISKEENHKRDPVEEIATVAASGKLYRVLKLLGLT